jgi:hypothetical protein
MTTLPSFVQNHDLVALITAFIQYYPLSLCTFWQDPFACLHLVAPILRMALDGPPPRLYNFLCFMMLHNHPFPSMIVFAYGVDQQHNARDL